MVYLLLGGFKKSIRIVVKNGNKSSILSKIITSVMYETKKILEYSGTCVVES